MKQTFQVWHNTDTIEGRGPMRHVGTFATRGLAELVAIQLPTDMGGGKLYDIREDWVCETAEEVELLKNQSLVDSAKKKLSQAEYSALQRYFERVAANESLRAAVNGSR